MSVSAKQSIDEHTIKFKGHNILKQYMKRKPVQWDLKLWCRCDSKTGYLFQFDLYTGKMTSYVEHGLSKGVVFSLTNNIKDLLCQIFIDNFFNLPQLLYNPLRNGIYSAGTVRIKKKKIFHTKKKYQKMRKWTKHRWFVLAATTSTSQCGWTIKGANALKLFETPPNRTVSPEMQACFSQQVSFIPTLLRGPRCC